MAGQREYPPAPMVHRPDCPDIPLPYRGRVESTPAIALAHPNAWQHHCFVHTYNKSGVVESRYYPPHHYRPSTRWPDDAPLPTCEVCGGTHAGEQRNALKVAEPKLIHLPAAQLLLPGNARPGER